MRRWHGRKSACKPASLRILAWGMMALVMAMPLEAVGQEGASEVQRGLECYRNLDLPCARAHFRAALASPDLDREGRVVAYLHLGFTHVVLGERDAAIEAFLQALELDPTHRLSPSDSPKIREVFEEARRRFLASDQIAPSITHYPPPAEKRVPAGRKVDITANVTDNRSIESVTLYYRSVGDLRYLSTAMLPQGGKTFIGVIPAFLVTPVGVEYYIEARDEAGNVTLSASAADPYTIRVEREKAWYKKWWVWGIGAAVIGTSVGISLVAGGGGKAVSACCAEIEVDPSTIP
ncbi:MAG: tetratricopeptide repeat protein [Deltaproteobacteria bacterium]|nr:MAG: tetratricopeptide repeat protein [Deltaproteobacteria bacterium]